mmetsp:Transcript_26149/g.62787  ORF Transcript_26149/g.62787 Transcript_26149/m.62787 type:complete len:208 (+) Transcript_26149:452-1075(+)
MPTVCVSSLVRDDCEELVEALEVGGQAGSHRWQLRFDAHCEGRLELVVHLFFFLCSVVRFHGCTITIFLLVIFVALTPELLRHPILLLLRGLIPRHLQRLLHLIAAKFISVKHSLKPHWLHHLALHTSVILRIRRRLPVKPPELHHQIGGQTGNLLGARPLRVPPQSVRVFFELSREGELDTLSDVGDVRLCRGVRPALDVAGQFSL